MPQRPRVSVYIATSLDGFIAEPGGGLGFLDRVRGDGTEDHGYGAFMATIDAIVLGRVTYDVVLGFGDGAWPFHGKRVVVLTRRPLTPRHGEATHAGALAPLAAALAARGVRRVYLDGGAAVRQGLREDLVDDLVLSTVPVVLGAGIPLFGDLPRLDFRPEASRVFATGLVQTVYTRAREGVGPRPDFGGSA